MTSSRRWEHRNFPPPPHTEFLDTKAVLVVLAVFPGSQSEQCSPGAHCEKDKDHAARSPKLGIDREGMPSDCIKLEIYNITTVIKVVGKPCVLPEKRKSFVIAFGGIYWIYFSMNRNFSYQSRPIFRAFRKGEFAKSGLLY